MSDALDGFEVIERSDVPAAKKRARGYGATVDAFAASGHDCMRKVCATVGDARKLAVGMRSYAKRHGCPVRVLLRNRDVIMMREARDE